MSPCQTFKIWISHFTIKSSYSFYNNNNVTRTLNDGFDIKFHYFCMAAWITEALMAKMLIS